jgi:hypothetical protein
MPFEIPSDLHPDLMPVVWLLGNWHGDGQLELVLAHPTGYAEVWYGQVDGPRVTLATDIVARTSTAKEYTAGQRMYGLVEGALMYAYDMAAEGEPMQSHLWGKLARV